MQCDDVNGDCMCKEGFTGSKCDECKPNITGDKCDICDETFYNYPSCQSLSKQLVSIFLKINPILLHISDCNCNPAGSTTLECDDVNGDCMCKEGFTGSKCDECKPNITGDKCDICDETFYNYPSCQGLSNRGGTSLCPSSI